MIKIENCTINVHVGVDKEIEVLAGIDRCSQAYKEAYDDAFNVGWGEGYDKGYKDAVNEMEACPEVAKVRAEGMR